MSESLPESDRPWRLYLAVGLFVALFVAALLFAGRQETAEPVAPIAPLEQAGAQQRCETDLAGILAAVDPRELGLSSSQADRARDLNLWQADCAGLFSAQAIAQDEELVRRLLPAETANRTLATEFTPRDTAHLRTTLLMRQTAQHVTAGRGDPVDQAVALFDFVQRNVLEIGALAPTMTPYEVLLLGRGSAEQRAWLLAELLRQIELDAVVVRPAVASGEATDRWLLGVPIGAAEGGGVYLFDMHAGLPIPAPSESTATTVTVTRPATLAEVRADATLLTQLDTPTQAYRITADDLAQVQVALVGQSSLWSNRVATLDFATELRGAIFYDGLGTNRLREPALYDRIVADGANAGWTSDQVVVWDLPETQAQAYGTPAAVGQPLISNYLAMLAGPVVREITDPNTGLKMEWGHPLIDARHLHITGVLREAIRDYNQIRSGLGFYTVDPLNDLCRESAIYWTTGCQYELGEYASVVNTALRGSYPPGSMTGVAPIWPDGMAALAALSLAQQGQFAEAVTLLKQLRPAAPQGQQYLIRRWERLGAPPAAETPAETTTLPAAESPPPAAAPEAAPATPVETSPPAN